MFIVRPGCRSRTARDEAAAAKALAAKSKPQSSTVVVDETKEMQRGSRDQPFRYAVIGKQGVGKSSFVRRLQSRSRPMGIRPTAGVDLVTATRFRGNRPINICYFDVSGDQRSVRLEAQMKSTDCLTVTFGTDIVD